MPIGNTQIKYCHFRKTREKKNNNNNNPNTQNKQQEDAAKYLRGAISQPD